MGICPAKKRATRWELPAGRTGSELLPRSTWPRRPQVWGRLHYALVVLAKLLIALASSSWTSKTV